MEHFIEIPVYPKLIAPYKKFNPEVYRRIVTLAKKLHGRMVFHVNSTAKGGGVAEMLKSQVALEKGLGLNSRWIVICAPREFFDVTKKIHDLFQGKPGRLNDHDRNIYLAESQRITVALNNFLVKKCCGVEGAIFVIHDSQPLVAGLELVPKAKKLLRLHIDLSEPSASIVSFLRPWIDRYDSVIISRKDYRFPWLSRKRTKVIMPAIDPLLPKNLPMPQGRARDILLSEGINTHKPTIAQISRFDPWKDPIGVIDSYYKARNWIPDLQLLLAGFSEAADDLTAHETFKEVERCAEGDPGIYLFIDSNLVDINSQIFVSAVQTASDVVLQKSIREGFGLAVTEAMWKGKAVIGGKTAGIALQIQDGKNGFLVTDTQQTAYLIRRLINDKALRARMGRAARETVRKKFLIPRYLEEHLKLYTL